MLEDDTSLTDGPAVTTKPDGEMLTKRRRRGFDRTTAGVVALVALGGAGLYYMHARTAAAVAMVAAADTKAAKVDAMLTGGRDGLAALSRDVDTTRATIERFTTRDTIVLAAAGLTDRDPFVFQSLEPVATSTVVQSTNNVARDAAKAKALAAAQRLQLQSIMYGSARRSCLVDGKLYFEGQTLGEFTLSRISQDAVLLQTGEFRFELRLRK